MSEPSGPEPVPPQEPADLPAPMPPPSSYGAQFGVAPMPLNNNLGWAIASLLICWPFGIPSLIKALQVSSLWYQGQHPQAQAAADEAKKWGKIGVIVGACGYGAMVLLMVLYFVFIFVIIGASVTAVTQQ
ncbi:Interferon-induced transmembrane protein [Saccharopolyspora kobensis]|uniref:Interferon-induced transmembrane protein n=1 Tax=Saccharopolyspora kobensis TaxID=146035 RepID=A0A1H6E6Z2_9PSEU|nr:CD225/dispanin family protein [Saccharopolyspora kobensis]SEG93021.1 Interferon-induced transmembrane protein [Saccharopolyspora kobensis]SFD42130.1 Interferon-induced transmembrane protein [Saccharopolyspora kobensis]